MDELNAAHNIPPTMHHQQVRETSSITIIHPFQSHNPNSEAQLAEAEKERDEAREGVDRLLAHDDLIESATGRNQAEAKIDTLTAKLSAKDREIARILEANIQRTNELVEYEREIEALREAVKDFLAEGPPEGEYGGRMYDACCYHDGEHKKDCKWNRLTALTGEKE